MYIYTYIYVCKRYIHIDIYRNINTYILICTHIDMRDNDSMGTVLVVRSPASPLATSMMLHADQLANVLRFEVASEAGAARLHWMRGFLKEWCKAATCML